MPSTTITIRPPINGVDRRGNSTGGRLPGSCYWCLNVMPRVQSKRQDGSATANPSDMGSPVNTLGLRVRPPIDTVAVSGGAITNTNHRFFHEGRFINSGNPDVKRFLVSTSAVIDLNQSPPAIPTNGSMDTRSAATINGVTYFPVAAGINRLPLVAGAGTVEAPMASGVVGTVPTNCTLAVEYFGRLVVSGDTSNLGNVYLSRANEPRDWDYSRRDAIAAVALNTSQAVGGVLDRIKALINTSVAGLLIGGYRSLHYLRDNPAAGGRLEVVSRDIGVARQYAHCMDKRGLVYFISSGYRLCRFNPSTFEVEDLSAGRVGLFAAIVSLAYDQYNDGIWMFGAKIDNSGAAPIAITEYEGDTDFDDVPTHMFYKIDSGDGISGFFPMEEPSTFLNKHNSDGACLATNDGESIYISTDGITSVAYATMTLGINAADLSNTTAIKHGWHSWPVNPFGGQDSALAKTEITLQSSQPSATVPTRNQASLKVFSGESETDAILSTRRRATIYASSGSGYTVGRQGTINKRIRGHSFSFRMSNLDANGTAQIGGFELEKIEATFELGGTSRRR